MSQNGTVKFKFAIGEIVGFRHEPESIGMITGVMVRKGYILYEVTSGFIKELFHDNELEHKELTDLI